MNKSAKLLARLRSIPADFRWDELVAVLKSAGFVDVSDKAGSYRTFVNADGRKLFLHQPHPRNILKKYAIRDIVEQLDALGIRDLT